MGIFTRIKTEEQDAFSILSGKVIPEVEKIAKTVEEKVVETVVDTKTLLDQKRQKALNANNVVNKIKKDLQNALIDARDFHLAAIKVAQEAQAAAEADIVKFKSWITAHMADVNTLNKQITPPPSAPANVPPSGDPVPENKEPDNTTQQ